MLRRMSFRRFYPGDCRRQIADMLHDFSPPPDLSGDANAVVVPHAGWRYSGAVAARALKTLAAFRPSSLILLSAVHRIHLASAALYPRGAWETPLGLVDVDETLAGDILTSCGEVLEENGSAHRDEHALEVILPFVRELLPETPVVPIMVPPGAHSVELGERLAEVAGDRPVAVVASTDLTHYGRPYGFLPAGTGSRAHDWMRRNDRRLIDRALEVDADVIVGEALENRNACGPGALAAAVAYARARGSREGRLLERTDSHEAGTAEEEFEMAVGYAGILL